MREQSPEMVKLHVQEYIFAGKISEDLGRSKNSFFSAPLLLGPAYHLLHFPPLSSFSFGVVGDTGDPVSSGASTLSGSLWHGMMERSIL